MSDDRTVAPPGPAAPIRTPGAAAAAPDGAGVGVAYGLASYLWWGGVAVYFKAVASVPPLEVLAHRVVWSVLLLGGLLAMRGQVAVAVRAMADRRTQLTLLGTTALIAVNWLVFIYAVGSGRIMQASLGYFINPLVNVVLGFVFLRERLRPWQVVSVALAAAGVCWNVYHVGHLPWIALTLAFTFGFYGLLRKIVRIDALAGLAVETTMLAPLAVGYVGYLMFAGRSTFGGQSWAMDLLLIAAGPVTALPLLWFTNAARRVRMMTLGFMQYLAPTGQFLLATLVYRETMRPGLAGCFALIWAGLIIYTADAWRASRVR
jgi:chloramphenicol-sensitive protein RarD